MIYGVLIWTTVVAVILVIVSDHRWAMLSGAVAGGLAAVGLLFHMYRHLDIALDMDPKHAGRHTQGAAICRMMIMAVCMGASMYLYRWVHPLGMVLGLFGVKTGAFLQPAVHRFCNKHRML